MYVRGTASTVRRPARRPSSTSAFVLCFENRPPPARAASSSTTRTPMLCRVSAYSGPGLPSPTTSAPSELGGTGPSALVSGGPLRRARGLGGGRLLDDSRALGVGLGLEVGLARRGDHVDHQRLRVGLQLRAVGQRNRAREDLRAGVNALDGDLD